MERQPSRRDIDRLVHELNTSLTVISGRLQLLRRRSRRSDGDVTVTRDELAGLLAASDRLAAVVEEAERALAGPRADDLRDRERE